MRIIQIATGQQPMKAEYAGQAALNIVLWALVEDGNTSELAGLVMDPATKQLVRANELAGFRGYSP